jgi:uncharacterized protein (TIGR02118 family)
MIKLVYCIRRNPDKTPEEFHRYWLETHGPLVRSVAADIGAARYVQSHTAEPELNALLATSRGSGEPYDGITEVWWNSVEEMAASMSTPAGQDAQRRLVDDEATFIDFANSTVFMTEEHTIFE